MFIILFANCNGKVEKRNFHSRAERSSNSREMNLSIDEISSELDYQGFVRVLTITGGHDKARSTGLCVLTNDFGRVELFNACRHLQVQQCRVTRRLSSPRCYPSDVRISRPPSPFAWSSVLFTGLASLI